MPSFRWIVSAEDSDYMAWQCLLFRHSARTRCGAEPTFFVHEMSPGSRVFRDMEAAGASLARVPSYRTTGSGANYAPRNTAGTLLEASGRFGEDFFVLFDPDFVFREPVAFEPALSADRVPYAPSVEAECRGKLPPDRVEWLRAGRMGVGVPYVVPRETAGPLAREWLRLIDERARPAWTAVMWDFAIAALRLGSEYSVTSAAGNNSGYEPCTRPMIHYCYRLRKGDDSPDRLRTWHKGAYRDPGSDPYSVFRDAAARGSMYGLSDANAEVVRQLREAAASLPVG